MEPGDLAPPVWSRLSVRRTIMRDETQNDNDVDVCGLGGVMRLIFQESVPTSIKSPPKSKPIWNSGAETSSVRHIAQRWAMRKQTRPAGRNALKYAFNNVLCRSVYV